MIEKTIPETTKHFVDAAGKYVGHRRAGHMEVYDDSGQLIETRSFDDGPPLPGSIEVPSAPLDLSDTWDGARWAVGDRPEFAPTDLEVAVQLLKAADPAAFATTRQQIIDARKAAAGGS